MKMNVRSHIVRAVFAVAVVALTHPVSVQACAACFGKSDAPMAKGMNWGIISLLCVVGMVLSILSAFFVFLAVKANGIPVPSAAAPAAPATAEFNT